MLYCVPDYKVCDNYVDCSDASDELDCGDRVLQCADGYTACQDR